MTECCSGSAGERSELLAGGRSGQEIAGGEPMANACSASCACAWARGARTPPEERQSLNATAASPAPLDRSHPPPHRPPWGRCTERRATGARTRSYVRSPQRKLTPVVEDVPPSSSHQLCVWRPPMRALPRSQRLSLSKPTDSSSSADAALRLLQRIARSYWRHLCCSPTLWCESSSLSSVLCPWSHVPVTDIAVGP